MIAGIACLVFPLLSGCSSYVDSSPPVAAIVSHPGDYSRKPIVITGTVRSLDEWRTRSGFGVERFMLCQDACVRIFADMQSPISNGQQVSVRGTFWRTYRTGTTAYRNEIIANEVFPRQ